MKRRKFLKNTVAVGTLLGAAGMTVSSCADGEKKPHQDVRIQESGKYDILLKGGFVIDPANNINGKMDVAVTGGKIAVVGENVPARDSKRTIDVSDLYVTPGFVDIHEHVFHTFDIFSPIRSILGDDHSFTHGVTTICDAGTSGVDDFEDFKKIIEHSRTRILALINISAPGMIIASEQEPSTFKVQPLVELAKKYPDTIVGIKTAHYKSRGNFDKEHPPWASVDASLEAGRLANLPVMYHSDPRAPSNGYPARSFRELVLEKMRPGDIHTHCYGAAYPTVDDNGKINPDVLKARERGVIFDVGDGGGGFIFRKAVPAIEQGFLPDSISSDIFGGSTNRVVLSMNNIMSKFLGMGVSLENVIRFSTVNPAHEINHPELGTLSVGSTADIAVIEVIKGNFAYDDSGRGKIRGDKKIKTHMTLFGGEVVYDGTGLNQVYWEDIPKDGQYWVNPNEQKW